MNYSSRDVSQSAGQAHMTTLLLFSAAALQVVWGGVRFVDGGALLQFSQVGFQAQLQLTSQYLFDSPLKILFLQALHLNSPVLIGALFIALTFLPLVPIWIFARDLNERTQLLAIATILPIWKLMFQNTGVGDSVVIAGAIVLAVARNRVVLAAVAFLMLLWHFQQSALIAVIVVALCAAERGPNYLGRLVPVAIGALAGAAAFAIIEIFLVPPHLGRGGYILSIILPTFLRQNFSYLPIALSAIVSGTIFTAFVMQRLDRTRHWLLFRAVILATVAAICIGGITEDFSRNMLILTVPIVFFVASPRAEPSRFPVDFLDPQKLVPLLAVAVVAPFYASWHGIDIFLWPRLFDTFQKYLGWTF